MTEPTLEELIKSLDQAMEIARNLDESVASKIFKRLGGIEHPEIYSDTCPYDSFYLLFNGTVAPILRECRKELKHKPVKIDHILDAAKRQPVEEGWHHFSSNDVKHKTIAHLVIVNEFFNGEVPLGLTQTEFEEYCLETYTDDEWDRFEDPKFLIFQIQLNGGQVLPVAEYTERYPSWVQDLAYSLYRIVNREATLLENN